MEQVIKKIDGGKVQVTFTLTTDEQAKFESRVIKQASAATNISGFRPGFAPDAMVRARLGAETISQETMFEALKAYYPDFIKQQKLEVVGDPQLALQSVSPFTFYVTVTTIPEVMFSSFDGLTVAKRPVVIDDKQVSALTKEIQESRVSEALVTRPAKMEDLVKINFEVAVAGVVIEGGKNSNYPVILGRGVLVPGFEEQLVGMSAGEEKQFTITFPSDYRKDLAGKEAVVKTKVLEVFERTLPEITDEFVKAIGKFEHVADFNAKLKDNLQHEEERREESRVEREMLEALLTKASFSEIPQLLIDSEAHKMVHEFRHGLEERGLEFVEYLKSLGKDETSLRKEFSEPALKRVKLSLIIRALAKREGLEADEISIERELAETLEQYAGDAKIAEQINTDDYRDYVRSVLTNRRVIEWLKKKLVKVS